jgi:outer membrane biosynthesis protein TonB
MKLPAKCVAGLLLLVLCGCTHKTNQAQNQPLAPPIVDTPPPAKPTPPPDLPPPVVTPPQPTQQTTTASAPAQTTPAPKPHHKKPAAKPADQNANSTQSGATSSDPGTTQQAANSAPGASPGVSAVGQLTTGDTGGARSQTEDSIAATEKGLRDIGRKLSDQEEKTAEQIREYLKEARKALTTGDVDGAHTLADKAKVLLSELTQ